MPTPKPVSAIPPSQPRPSTLRPCPSLPRRAWRWLQLPAQLRVLVLCAYPILGAAIVFYVSALSDQGIDLLLNALDQLSWRHDVLEQTLATRPVTVLARAALSGLSVVVAALSIWWPARLLLERRFRYFPIEAKATAWLRQWLPRLLAAAVLVGVAWGYARIAWRLQQWPPAVLAVLWAVAAVALGWMLSRRRDFVRRLRVALLRRVRRPGLRRVWPGRRSAPAGLHRVHGALSGMKTGVIVGFCLAYVALAIAFAVWPVGLPRVFGGTALIFFGVGGLTFIATMTIAYLPLSKRNPSWTVLAAIYVLVVSSWLDNHGMRAVEDALPAPPSLTPLQRADAWESARLQGPCRRDGEAPVLYVAAAGGGIRAAYWTARVLEELSLQLGSDFDCSLFALSGVSGGSLGVAAYVAVNRDHGVTGAVSAVSAVSAASVSSAASAATTASRRSARRAPPDAQHGASQSLGQDFLSPAVAGLLFYDAVQRVVPFPFAGLDRSRGLESAFQRAFDWVDGTPFRHPLRALDAGSARMPIVFLNATVVEDGRRAIQSNIDLGDDFVDVYDLDCPRVARDRAPSTATISLAAAVHNSARFTYVSPAGRIARLGHCSGVPSSDARLVDGGYFENSGAAPLAQLLCTLNACDRTPATTAASAAASGPSPPVAARPTRPVLLLIRNSPGTRPYCTGLHADDHCVSLSADPGGLAALHPSPLLPEITSPLQALLSVREQRERLAVVAAAEAFRSRGGVVVEAYLPLQEKTLPEPPLGWSLSPGVRVALDDAARTIVAGCRQTLGQVFAGAPMRRSCDKPDAAQAASQRATRIATERPSAASAAGF